MGLSSLFGPKAPTFGVYGKLPISKEFLRIKCSDGAGREYYRFVNGGFDHAAAQGASSEKHQDEPGAGWRWLFFAEGYKDVVVACLRSSADFGGLRSFPFSCFAAVRRDRMGDTMHDMFRSSVGLWEQLEAADRELSSCESREALGRDAAGIEIELNPGFIEGKGAVRGPLDAAAERQLFELSRAVRTLLTGRVPGARIPAVRLPLDPASPALAQVYAYLESLESTPFLSARSTPVSIALPSPAIPGATSAWIIPRPPRPADFSVMQHPGETAFFPDPGGEMVRLDGETETDFVARLRAAFGTEPLTHQDFARFSLV